ncbi:hypothetical protein ACMDCR_14060 [Labrys okinawensis]|uniref:hypothetical protein n=1 Tax=Labrys okinawensis TaxID=346911 RepID=UPI0039BC5B5A
MSLFRKEIATVLLFCVSFIGAATGAFAAWPTRIDDAVLRSYGYIGDGGSHPLSSIATYNGVSTSQWQLSNWQAVLPAATSMSDEIDGAVVNSLIKGATQQGSPSISFQFGTGTAEFSQPITACGINLTIKGTGTRSTILAFGQRDTSGNKTISINALNFCADKSPATSATSLITVEDLYLLQELSWGTPPTATSQAINIIGKSPITTGDFYTTAAYISNVDVFQFGNCLNAEYLANTTVSRLYCRAGVNTASNAEPATGTGMKFVGSADFIVHVFNSSLGQFQTGMDIEAQGGAFEDVLVKDTNIGQVKGCVKIGALNSDGTPNNNYSPLQYTIDNMACSATSSFVEAQNASHLNIHGGTWLVWSPTGRTVAQGNDWVATGADFFKFCRVENAILRDAWVSADGSPLTFNSYVYVKGDNETDGKCNASGAAIDVRLLDNKFSYFNLGTVPHLIYVGHNAVGTQARGNTFSKYFNVTSDPPLNTQTVNSSNSPTGNTVTAYSWGTTDPNAALFFKPAGESIPVVSSATTVLNATETSVGTATLTPGVWTCKGMINYSPSTNTTFSQLDAYMSTTAPPAYRTPSDTMYQDFNKTFLQPVNLPVSGRTFDLSTATQATTVYLTAYAVYTTGTMQSSFAGDCTRVR